MWSSVNAEFNLLRIGPLAGSCEESNELSGSTKEWQYLDHLHDYQLPKKSTAHRVMCIFFVAVCISIRLDTVIRYNIKIFLRFTAI
jgi:hypothetical protein